MTLKYEELISSEEFEKQRLTKEQIKQLRWKDYQKYYKFKETNYGIGNPCPYDIASPAFYIKDHKDHGKALKMDYKMKKNKKGELLETIEEYWSRVRKEITDKHAFSK